MENIFQNIENSKIFKKFKNVSNFRKISKVLEKSQKYQKTFGGWGYAWSASLLARTF